MPDVRAALSEYDIGDELGRGGFGLVRAGRHRHLKRDVAIKELPAALATEARVLASLSHPHIVPIYDYVERDGLCLLVMEYLPGGTAWSLFKEKGFGPETTCAVVMAVCAGLHYAHQRGVLHRDVKPENVLFSAEHVLKLTDFGIAKVVGGSETLATRGGDILGTPAYMAPEQAQGTELTPAADVFAAGVMLYELLSGHLPYSEEGGALAIVYRHVYEDPIPMTDAAPDVLPGLAEVTMRALARSPDDRYPTAEAFGVAIGEAVTAEWGPDWLSRSDLQIVDPGPIAESAKRVSHASARSATGVRRGPAGVAVEPGTVRVPPPSKLRTPASPPPGNETAAARPPSRLAPRVRPNVDAHVVGGGDIAAGDAELVPVRQVIELPRRPYPQLAATAVLLLCTVAVAFIGLSSPEPARAIGSGMLTVAGMDATGNSTVRLDLAEPVAIQLRELPPQAAGATRVQLGTSVAGVALPASTAEPLAASDQGLVAMVEADSLRFLIAGEATGEVRLLAGDEVVLGHEFVLDSEQPAFLTVPGVVVVGLLLFLLAYVESLLRPLRRGRRRVTGLVGMGILGAGVGLVLVPFAWLLGGAEPTMTTAVVSMLLGTGAAISAALAAIRVGRRARIRPRRA
jgi:serine/threonine protein kinase